MDGYPFRHELVDAGFTGHDIQTFAEYPEIIMRQDSEMGNAGLQLDRAKTFRTLFQELSEYGIATPNPRFVVSYDTTNGTGHATTHIVADRVHGKSLKEPGEEVPPDVCLQALSSVTEYFKHNIRKGGHMLADLALYQCIYGSTARSKTPQTYFVDLDMSIAQYSPGKSREDMSLHEVVDVESLCYNLVCHAEYAQQLQESTGIDTRHIVHDIAATVHELPYTGNNDEDLEILRSCVAAVHGATGGC